ncbi:ATP-binding protein [Ensifer sp. LCM 4579]|uniref:ATP-binding protein n=1 Tax=Ensifer sp. LCM 4579 TaxID=1848292 RepID=UPI0008DA5A19|nr:ATP-binding protein [Ensifer sp. LCM 4579]OHV81302.1 hypothetical protein LCM4579_19885 [Ensifer sp. LCM 4579]
MVKTEIDYARIRPYGGSRDRGFEELVCQLASLEPHEPAAVFHRKGIGADGGVECFVRRPDRTETGWQAKYFFGLGAAQIGQLDKSIEQALEKHPRLNRFIVALPFDLKDARIGKKQTELQRWEAWTARWKGEAAKTGRSLEFELWGASQLTERLSRNMPLYRGRAVFWFDETILTPLWFRQRFEMARAALGARYTPETNIDLPIRRTIQQFCRDPSLMSEIEEWSLKLNERGYRVIDQLARFDDGNLLERQIEGISAGLRLLNEVFSTMSSDPDYMFPLELLLERVSNLRRAGNEAARVFWELEQKADEKRDRQRYTEHTLYQLSDALDEVLEAIRSDRWTVVNSRRLLVSGEAGVGKSHLFGDAVQHQIERELPALLVLGSSLVEADPWSQIIAALGLQGRSTDELLGALDSAAQAAGVRAVLFIDAINERHGIDLWAPRIAAFLQSIEGFPNVGIALSCRTTYLPYIVPDDQAFSGLQHIEHRGFSGRPDAANEYLDRRGIIRMAAPNLIPEFYNPLFLKTCCDYLQNEGRRELPRGLTGVTEIFEFYSDAIARIIEARLKLDRRRKIVAQALTGLAAAFDDGYRGYTDLGTAIEILDKLLPPDGTVEKSLLTQLESEGVVAIEPVMDEDRNLAETVRFTFERYSDHRIATLLIDRHLDLSNPSTSFAEGTPLADVVTNDRAYERAGIIEALATQLPERCGHELPDLISSGKHGNIWLLNNAFLGSLLWRKQQYFTKRTLELLEAASKYTGENELLRTLIAIATEPENQFNARFLDRRLRAMSMPERDSFWSVRIIDEGETDDSPIETLIAWTLQNGFHPIEEQRAELAAIALSWLFTTSHRAVRDRATKALSTLFAPRLGIAARLIREFVSVNDPYVVDRLLAAAYGAALQGIDRAALPELAANVWETVFADGKPPVHTLIRDHARGIIELAAHYGALPAGVDLVKVRPPYQSAWPLEEVSSEMVEAYKQDYPSGRYTDSIVSSTVHDGDFARYVIDSSVGGWTAFGIECAGSDRDSLFRSWQEELATKNPGAAKRLTKVLEAAELLRISQKDRPLRIEFVVVEPGRKKAPKPAKEPAEVEWEKLERKLISAEKKLRSLMSEDDWKDYQLYGQSYVYAGTFSRRGHLWPPRPDTLAMRRWVCKRAHDLGWTPQRFAALERNLGSSGRMEHRIERIGKKYQWIAVHELTARMADHLAYREHFNDVLQVFDGPWGTRGRDIDPSLLVERSNGDGWRSWDRTWWMPATVRMKSAPPATRLAWLDSNDDFVNDETLIRVKDPSTGRRWLVLDEFAAWYQWGVRRGDKEMERKTWFSLKSLLVRSTDADAIAQRLSGRGWSNRDLPELEIPWRGYLGEYPWHPVYAGIEHWVPPDEWHGLPTQTQPTVSRYGAERGGYDFSLADSLSFYIPAPGLMRGLGLGLSNGKELTYSDRAGNLCFFDPSTRELGPSAALVDEAVFLDFLKRESLVPIWIISGEKSVHGGRSHGRGYGGTRSFTSVYRLQGDGFSREDLFHRHDPSSDQLQELFDAVPE